MGAPHEHRIRVRYVETDQMGIVHHTNHLVYLEEGRTAFMAALGFPYLEVERRGLAMGVRRIDLRYRQVARYGDEVLVRTSIGGFRGASIDYEYELVRAGDGELLLTGTVEVVCLSTETLKPAPLPADIRAVLELEVGRASR